jgi:hypothetical protein
VGSSTNFIARRRTEAWKVGFSLMLYDKSTGPTNNKNKIVIAFSF